MSDEVDQDPNLKNKPGRKHPRNHFRARSHASAHADHSEKTAPAIPHLPLVPRNAPALLATQDELDELITHVRAAGSFAYDSEFIGELSYHPLLCVIQVATAERVALIDSLAELDLRGFWELLADPSLEKIVHAGEQDLEPVHRNIGRRAANIFDTQVAAGFCGYAYPSGLSKLVKEILGVHLGKGFTFTHWDQRPLTSVQLRYAADDVRYLPALRATLGAKLDKNGHTRFVSQECTALCDPSLHAVDFEKDFLRIRGAGSLTPKHAAVLRALFAWREDAAHRHDSPPRSYVKDEILVDIARRPPKDIASLDQVKHLPRPVEEEEGENILDAISKGLAAPPETWPIIPTSEERPSERFESDALWAIVQAWCHGRGIDPALVASRAEVVRFLRNGATATSRITEGWRNEVLGDLLQNLLAGNAKMELSWRKNTPHAKPA